MTRALYLEPFEGGSHAGFTRVLTQFVRADWTSLTLPGRYWKWRMRGAAPYWALHEPKTLRAPYDLLIASSYLPLAELIGLVPELRLVPSILYFHENQLAYPTQDGQTKERDNHFGVSQLVSGLAATRLVFNSQYNLDSFYGAARTLLARLPDRVPPGWVETLEQKSEVLGVPLALPQLDDDIFTARPGESPLILWNHRWEHDKAPEVFAKAILQLHAEGLPFRLALCGQRFSKIPPGFEELRRVLGPQLLTFGTAETRTEYEYWLRRADLAVSTAVHEFFGVAMIEATHFGACPLVPDDLAYPEIFAEQYRYPRGQLVQSLRSKIEAWLGGTPLRADRRSISAPYLKPMYSKYEDLMARVASGGILGPKQQANLSE